jgi:hypothetical protein
MDFPGRSAKERAAHYEREAEEFRRMGEAETVEYICVQLFGLAVQYQQLAEGLRSGRPLVGEPQ